MPISGWLSAPLSPLQERCRKAAKTAEERGKEEAAAKLGDKKASWYPKHEVAGTGANSVFAI